MSGIREKLAGLFVFARQEQRRFFESLSEEERQAQGSREEWAIKDHFAHVISWEEHEARNMEMLARGEMPPISNEDVDTQNAHLYDQKKDLTWEQLLEASDAVTRLLEERIFLFSEEQLCDPALNPYNNEHPLWTAFPGGLLWHAVVHFSDYYLSVDRLEDASAIQARYWQASQPFFDNARIRGISYYDRACYLARSRQIDAAFESLREGLATYPDLTEWSRQDPDLVNLHNDPRWQTL